MGASVLCLWLCKLGGFWGILERRRRRCIFHSVGFYLKWQCHQILDPIFTSSQNSLSRPLLINGFNSFTNMFIFVKSQKQSWSLVGDSEAFCRNYTWRRDCSQQTQRPKDRRREISRLLYKNSLARSRRQGQFYIYETNCLLMRFACMYW